MAEEVPQEEVTRLAGDRLHAQRQTKIPIVGGAKSTRVGQYLSDQKVPISVPRVRNVVTDEEVSLQTYHHLQRPRRMDEGLLQFSMIKGICCSHGLIKPVLNHTQSLWAVLIDCIETLYQGVGRKIKTVPGTLFGTV